MATDYAGRGAALGFGIESTWGTPVARTNWMRAVSCDLRRQRPRQRRNVLYNGAVAPVPQGYYTERDIVAGSFTVECGYSGIAFLLEWALGASASSGTASPYTHTQSLSAEAPFGLTIEHIRGSGTAEVFEGVFCDSFTISVSAEGGPMQFTANVIGETSASRTTAGTPTFPSADSPVLYHHADTLDWNSQNYANYDLSVSVTNNFGSRIKLGALTTKEPKRSDYIDLSVTASIDVDDALYAAYLAETESDLSQVFTGGSISGGNYTMTITAHNCHLEDVSDPINSVGLVRQELTFRPKSDGTNDGLAIAVQTAAADNRDNG